MRNVQKLLFSIYWLLYSNCGLRRYLCARWKILSLTVYNSTIKAHLINWVAVCMRLLFCAVDKWVLLAARSLRCRKSASVSDNFEIDANETWPLLHFCLPPEWVESIAGIEQNTRLVPDVDCAQQSAVDRPLTTEHVLSMAERAESLRERSVCRWRALLGLVAIDFGTTVEHDCRKGQTGLVDRMWPKSLVRTWKSISISSDI